MSSRVVLLVGNPRPHSRTRAAAEQVATLLDAHIGSGTARTIDLAEHVAIGFTDEPVRPAVAAPHALDEVRNAEYLLVATPSYKGTFTGLLKVFLDQLPHQALAGITAIPIAVAGSPDHATKTGAALAQLLEELGARATAPIELLDSSLADSGYVGTRAGHVLDALGAVQLR